MNVCTFTDQLGIEYNSRLLENVKAIGAELGWS